MTVHLESREAAAPGRGAPYGASADAIQYHYDIGNAFLALAQERGRNYSCAMYEEGDTHEQAQIRKLDYHIAQIRARGAARVLDIGCGWGALLDRLVTTAGVKQAVGLTLSNEQIRYIGEQYPHPNVDVLLRNWQDYEPEAPFDGIISLGAFEHFAKIDEDKVQAYRHFFRKCHDFLKPGGRLSLQTMGYGDVPRERRHSDLFIAREVFPESDLPYLADIVRACEMLFEVELVRNDRHDYVKTMRAWFENLRAHRREALELAPLNVVERYERLYRTMSYSFDLGAFVLYRITFRRIEPNRIDAGTQHRAALA
ncbi:class I SAM-dependent methyltransferase [Burkholderia pseudomallei]|uniref:class I SAM-dependent methyltransferase n=1 Tax=Burkholderia pseudomallei TaxID=28450 RepID=UPI000406E5AC|nr:class I SAM-dependent methyltransferase [Burkholderia pseudomallei]AIP18684.1 methyltransferase small domain protein [Burkholderia pseudomallei MSHR5855]AIP43445.1 methyltransferase small domain protein [Burkholderia pseudomallei MSHR5848]AJW56944.1 cyclopropane-fatty-acyl-phospholipid synthase [Burkholderia pseudomallei]APF95905.1 cyclopropane-fatty-acyl-phospholipid synthase [Burkholderia pseudomallei]APG01948.1 cyclopropane-fatty-acyl-phospholipid synthase [Burkholderia pseudomallei]